MRINRGHGDTAGLERLLLQLVQSRAGSDGRLDAALDELRSRLNGTSKVAGAAQPSVQSNPIPHIESLEERVADLAQRVRRADEAAASPDLDAQFRELNAALEASLNQSSPAALESRRNPAAPESRRNPAALESRRNPAALESRRGEAQQSELMQAIADLGPQIAQVAQGVAVDVASQIAESQHAVNAMARLEAIQRDLQALTGRAGRMDERTLTTLETISGALQRLAQRMPVAEAATMDEPRGQEKPPEPGDSRRATRKTGEPPKPGDSRRAAKKPDEPGDSKRATEKPDEPETVAIETHAAAPPRLASDARKPRKILVFAAAVLLIVSAGLLYGRLNTHGSQAPGAPGRLAPAAPAAPAPAAPPIDHKGSHAQDPGSGGSQARQPDGGGGGSQESPGRENIRRPPPMLETIPATRFDRASVIIVDPQAVGPGLILKSQSH